jgi:hypothetical protein
MDTLNNKIDSQLHNIFKDIYGDEESLRQAVSESKIAYSIVKQDALYRSISVADDDAL